MLLISQSCDPVKLQYVSLWTSGARTSLFLLPAFTLLSLFFKYTSPLSQSVSLTCPCPSASICPPSLFGKHNLFWLSRVLGSSLMVCVCIRKRDITSSRVLEHYMNHWAVWCLFTWPVCLPIVFVCVVWLALLATMLDWADGYAYWLNGWIKGEMWEGLDGGCWDVSYCSSIWADQVQATGLSD